MEILIATISILVITVLVWFANKFLPFRVCPICAGVSLTWLLMVVGVLSGQILITQYSLLMAVLMGGTVVGIAYQGEKRMSIAPENFLKFRTAVIVPGFILAYLAVNNISWLTLIIEAAVLTAVTYLFFVLPPTKNVSSPQDAQKIADLEEKMKNCC